jgi:hypothetical protein
MAIHEVELDALSQTGEQRRPVSGKDWLHEELVLVDQSQICQREGERHATHPHSSIQSGHVPVPVAGCRHADSIISLLSLDARRAFTGPYSDDCRRHLSSAPRSHPLDTVVVRAASSSLRRAGMERRGEPAAHDVVDLEGRPHVHRVCHERA